MGGEFKDMDNVKTWDAGIQKTKHWPLGTVRGFAQLEKAEEDSLKDHFWGKTNKLFIEGGNSKRKRAQLN